MDTDPLERSQRVVLGLLLEHHPRLLGPDEIRAGTDDGTDVDFALRRLTDDGLVNQLGQRFGLSRPAVRFDQIKPV